MDVALVTAERKIVEPGEFRSQVAAVTAALPASGELVNLCEDRARFLVVFAAALMRGRTVLLPSSRAPASIAELRAAYPGCAVVDDSFNAAATGAKLPDPRIAADFVVAIGHTSGTTGAPAAHAKTFGSFCATTALNAETLRRELARQGRTGRPWIVATVPPQHMYGLEMSVLLPLLAGFGVHGGKPLLPADVASALADVPSPRVLVSTPVHLRALVESAVEFPEVTLVVSATAPLDEDLARRVEERLGATLIEVFGSTETCVVATRRTAHEEGWRAYPGIRLDPDESGTDVRAPWLAREQRLHDVIDVRADGSFTIVGRGTDVIEVAGKRASLADLTRRLISLDGVEDAVVFQPPSNGGGQAGRCAALVVAPGLTAREVTRRIRPQVDAVFLPRPLILVSKLPRNELGKLPLDSLLEALAAARAASRA